MSGNDHPIIRGGRPLPGAEWPEWALRELGWTPEREPELGWRTPAVQAVQPKPKRDWLAPTPEWRLP
jgi:hypothetical protein